jgi:deoxyadenosine/deoxycytidine kinase
MVSSRQIIELIESEISKEYDDQVISAYKHLINRIEVLEDIELTNMYKDYVKSEEDKQREAASSAARIQAEKLFSHD